MKQKIKTWLSKPENKVLLVIFLFILILNCIVPYYADDWYYMRDDGKTVLDIFPELVDQYQKWTGRLTGQFFFRFMLMFPKPVWNIVNSIVFVIYVILTAKHTDKLSNQAHSSYYLALTASLLFLFTPVFGQTVLWITGASVYLWLAVILLAFTLEYRKACSEDIKHHWLLFFLFGLIAGDTNENTAGGCILLILFFLLIQKKSINHYHAWQFSGLAGMIIGYLFNLLSPGNTNRTEVAGLSQARILPRIITNIHSLTSLILNPKMLILLILIILSFLTAFYKKYDKKRIHFAEAYFAAGIVSALAMLASPTGISWDRTMFGAVTLIVISFLILFPENIFQKQKTSWKVLNACLSACTCIAYLAAGLSNAAIMWQSIKREKYVNQMKEEGVQNVVLPHAVRYSDNEYSVAHDLMDLSYEFNYLINSAYATHHNISSANVTSPYQWNLLYKNPEDPSILSYRTLDEYLQYLKSRDDYIGILVSMPLMIDTPDSYPDQFNNLYNVLNSNGFEIDSSVRYHAIVFDTNRILARHDDDSSIGLTYDSFTVSVGEDKEKDTFVKYDNQKYTNWRDGITLVVYNKKIDKIVDCITWDDQFPVNGSRTDLRYRI